MPANPNTLSEKVFLQLQNAIVEGKLAEGSKLNETELATELGVSRVPVREAIRQLETRGLVTRKPRSGVSVASLSLDELLEIYYVREALEGMACKLAAIHMTDDEIQGLRDLLHLHAEHIEKEKGQSYFQQEGDFDFHYRIVKGSHNDKLSKVLWGDLYDLVRMYRYRFSTSEGRPDTAFKEHSNIVDAIENRDPELAEMLMRRHISAARKHIEQRYPSSTSDQQR